MQDEPRDVGQDPTDRPSAERQLSRRSLWFIGALGISALVLGGIQLQRTVKDPFSVIRTQTKTTQPEEVALLELQAKDTDGDSISDYDELYSYNTSPYIADSDSDSVNDKDEVSRGTDPNCPEGKTCGVLTNANASVAVNAATNASATNTAASSGSPTAAQIREALLASGVSKTELDAVDDATLLSSYQSALVEEAGTNTNAGTVNGGVANTNATSNFENLTAPQIRQLLIANGVDAATLSGYDDATLIAVYQQALKEENSTTNVNTNAQ
jgi:hypothetical protein